MKTIAIANQKGGVGKTTTTVQAGLWFARKGMRVVVIDLDPQANTTLSLSECERMSTVSEFMGSSFDVPECVRGLSLVGTDRVSHARAWARDDARVGFLTGLERLEKAGCDLVVIDTAPALDVSLQAALLGSDHVLVPVKLEMFSMMGMKELLSTIGRVRAANPRLNFLGMLPTMKDSRTQRHRRYAEDLVEAYGREYVVPVTIGLRGSVPEATLRGMPLAEFKGSSAKLAAVEFEALGSWLFDAIGFR